jgi:hypothetical protein
MGTINRRSNLANIAASLAMLFLVALSFGGNTDKLGQEYTETGLKRALITFASTRAINGLISVAQGTEVTIQPGGIGAVLTPGEILDPINDLVEQFSQTMLFSSVVLGTQKLLIEMSGWVWYSALLACVVLFVWLGYSIAKGLTRYAREAPGGDLHRALPLFVFRYAPPQHRLSS